MRKRGSVWLANLNPGRGTEPGKIRPVLIVQSQALLDAEHPSTLVVPLTTHLIEDAEPLRLRIAAQSDLDKESDLLLDQLRAIDNKRLIQGPLLQCTSEFMRRVDQALIEVLDILSV
ncbi:MAG: type II toxin-antitoxin system PemK/MazF family toxin [Gammaproteobacteria bacterium]|nr:type II toxin-antitoxin system PemK/MazF family toxin [Gammaproteobacteria bacterium]